MERNAATPITPEEQATLLSSEGYSRDTASGLVRRVHYWIGLYGAVRGQQHADLTVDMVKRKLLPVGDTRYACYTVTFNAVKTILVA